jgi:hypothetical protein
MPRIHNIDGVEVPYTVAEEAEADAQQAAHLAAQPSRDATNAIQVLENSVTPRRIREMTTQAGKDWVDNVEAQIAVLRGQL